MFEGLRRELEAKYADMAYSPLFARYRQMGGMPFFVFTGDTPSDRWEYFLRLNREVTTELMPVKVADFVSQIADPTAEQIRSFYEQYKNDYPYYNQFPWPELPTPGFKQPFKAQFQYVKSNYEKRMAEEQPKITEQEIADYYEKFKDTRFKKAKLPELPGKKPGEELEKPAGEPTDQTPTTDAKGADSKSGEKSAEKKTDTPPADGSTKGQKSDSKSAAGKTDGKSGAKSSAGKSDVKSSGSKDSKAKSTDGKQSSLTPKSLDGELLAMADEAAPVAKSPAPDTKSSDNKTPDTQAPDTQTPDTQTTSTPPPVEYEPLEKVSDTIRKDLARQRIEERAGAQFSLIEGMLDDYRIKLERYRANVTTNKNAKKPEPPSLAELLEKANATDLEGKQTDPISDRQAYNDTDVGKSRK